MRWERSSVWRRRHLSARQALLRSLRTDWRSEPTGTYSRASTMCLWEFDRPSTFPPTPLFRKARVAGLAYTRKCPRCSLLPGRNRERSMVRFGFINLFGRLDLSNMCTNRLSGIHCPCNVRHVGDVKRHSLWYFRPVVPLNSKLKCLLRLRGLKSIFRCPSADPAADRKSLAT
jgi:hypothetical protein